MNIRLSTQAKKDLRKVPTAIRNKFFAWTLSVEAIGLPRTRMIKGLHDEPLKGQRSGQRSIRLNRAYRAIYKIMKDGSVEFILIEEINKHEY